MAELQVKKTDGTYMTVSDVDTTEPILLVMLEVEEESTFQVEDVAGESTQRDHIGGRPRDRK